MSASNATEAELDTAKSKRQLIEELQELRARVAALEQHREQRSSNGGNLGDLQHLYRTAPVGLCLMDSELRFVHINEMLAQINGKPVSEHIGKRLRDVVPDIAERVTPFYQQVIATGQSTTFELRTAVPGAPDRERNWIVQCDPYVSAEGEILGVSTVVQEITEQKTATEALRESEEFRRSITDSSPDHILLLDREANIRFVNRAVSDLSVEEVVGTSVYEYVPEEFHPVMRACYAQVLETGKPGRFEVEYHGRNGNVRVFESRVGPVMRGNDIVGMTVNATDITERKRAETELRHRERQYRSIFETTSDGLAVLTPDGSIVDANPAFCRMHGYSRDECRQSPTEQLIDPDSLDDFRRFMGELNAGRSYNCQAQGIRKDGSVFDVVVEGTPFEYAGQPHLLAIVRDVTKEKLAEESLRQAHDELNRLMTAVSDYLWCAELKADGEFQYRYYSPVVEKITGRPTEFYMEGPNRWLSTIHADDRGRLEAAMGRIASRQTMREEEEYRVIRPDGSIRWVRDSATVSRLDDGGILLHGVVSDITERKEADMKLRASEERFRAIFDAVSDGIFIFDESGRRLDVNQRACEMHGMSRVETLSTEIGFLSVNEPPYNPEHARKWLQKAVDEGQPQQFEWWAKHSSGQRWWAEVDLRPAEIAGTKRILGVVRDITERKQAEAKLRRLSKVFMDAADPIVIEDMSGRILDMNPEAERAYGWTREELLGEPVLKLVPERRLAMAQELAQRCRNGEVIRNWEGLRLHKNGTEVPILVTLSLHTDESGQPVGIASISKDITEWNQAEAALRESEERFRTIFNSVSDAIFIYDANGKRLDANVSACAMYGYSRDELLARDFDHFTPDEPPLSLEEAREEFMQIVEDGQPRISEWRVKHRSGRRWWAEIQMKGVAIGGQERVLSVVRDVTARKLAEQRLKESEQQYRTLVETMKDGLAAMDTDMTVTYVNDRFCEILGCTPDDLIGESILDVLGEEAREFLTVCNGRERQTITGPYEKAMTRKDGQQLHLLVSPTRIRDENGQLMGSFVVVTEITQLKQTTEELQRIKESLELRVQERTEDLARANEHLKFEIQERTQAEEQNRRLNTGIERASRMRVLGEVAAGIAHQLHQPLAAISYSADGCRRRLERGKTPVKELIERLQEIASESLRAGEIIRRIRAFVAKQELAREPLEVNDVVRDALRLAKFRAGEQGVRLEVQLADNLPVVVADGIQLIQVLLNLLINGMEAMADTKPERRKLSVRTHVENKFVQVDVADRGKGIDNDLGEEIFEQFFTTKKDGLGIGLAISRSIVEAHDGRLWYDSRKGVGTVFRFKLPASAGIDSR